MMLWRLLFALPALVASAPSSPIPADFLTHLSPPGSLAPTSGPIDTTYTLLAILSGIEFYALQPYTTASERCLFDASTVRIVPFVPGPRIPDWEGRIGLWSLFECGKKILAAGPPPETPEEWKEHRLSPANCGVVYPAGQSLANLIFFSTEPDGGTSFTLGDPNANPVVAPAANVNTAKRSRKKRAPADDADAALRSLSSPTQCSLPNFNPPSNGHPYIHAQIGDLGPPLPLTAIILTIAEFILHLAAQSPRPEYITALNEFESQEQGVYVSVQPVGQAEGFLRPQYAHLIRGLRQVVLAMDAHRNIHPAGGGGETQDPSMQWRECDFVVLVQEATERVVLSGRVRKAVGRK